MASEGIEVAVGYVSLIPSTRGFDKELKRQLSTDRIGLAAGADLGESLAAGLRRTSGDLTDALKGSLTGADRIGAQAGQDIGRRLTSEVGGSGDAAGRRWATGFENSASRAEVKIDVQAAGRDAGESAGDSFMGGFGGSLAGMGLRGGPVVAGLSAAAVALGKIVGPMVAESMKAELNADLIQASLGLNPETMARIGNAAGKAYGNNFGESVMANMDAAEAAFQSGLLPRGADDKSIQSAIEGLTTVATILGEEIPATARAASQMVKTGVVPDTATAFDLLVKSAQNGLNVSGDLLDTVTEYSTQFRKLGLDGSEAMALISQMVKNGARDTDLAADALKEFSIRVTDNSEATRGAFESIGLNADQMYQKFLAGGESAQTAMQEVITAINNNGDAAVQNEAKLALFGTQFEDLGGAANNLDLRKAVDEFGEVGNASQRAADTMASNSMSEWETAKRNIVGKITEIKEALNMQDWGITIPTAINDLFDGDGNGQSAVDYLLGGDKPASPPPGAPGVKPAPAVTAGPAVASPVPSSKPAQNPLDVLIPRRADGGSILGPGPDGKDSVLMWGAPGEHVLTADDVDALGGQSAVYDLRRALHSGGLGIPGYEKGGQPGYGLKPGTGISYGGKGFPDWVYNLADQFGLKASTYAGHQEKSGLNRGIDWSGPAENMRAFADYAKTIPGLEQLIFMDPRDGAKIGVDPGDRGANQSIEDYYRDDWGGHTDHVHTRQSSPLMGPAELQSILDGQSVAQQAAAEPPIAPANTDAGRTEGYIPAGAGYSGKTGGGVVGGFIDMGGEFLKGAIDTAAQAAKMGMAASTMGASAAGGAAGGMGIDMAAQAGKRLVDWGTEMAGIGVGAASEIFLPFGAPRLLSDVDPTSFMPNMSINPAATTTGEKAYQAVAEQQGLVDPATTQHGTGVGAAPGPVQPQVPVQPEAGAMHGATANAAQLGPAVVGNDHSVNLTNVSTNDPYELAGIISKQQNLNAMQYSGRP